MELGNKIKTLRLKAGLTQEKLAEELCVSFQTISKWENNVCAPDISMLPKLSVIFGVTIDELFDLTKEQRFLRIGNMLDMEKELPYNVFVETIDYLKEQLDVYEDKGKIYSMLAHVYHHRMVSDSDVVSNYAKKAMQLKPEVKDCQWLLMKSKGAVAWDWNVSNHHRVIAFYKELVAANPKVPMNYLYLMDNLLEDNRTEEVKEYLEIYRTLEGHKEFHVGVYEAYIALAEHKVDVAEEKLRELEERFPENGGVLFELASYHAKQCHYEQALHYFEKSFEIDKKPRYTDALEGMALIYEIQGKYKEAIQCCDRMLKVLDEEWDFKEGEPVRVVMEEKQRLQSLDS